MAIVYPENAATRRSVNSHGNFERNYRAALRHSRHVRWLRVGVPVAIAAVLVTVVAINYMPPIGGFRLPGDLGKLVIHGTMITMQQPRLTGFTTDSRAYEFSADSAAQDITKPNLVELRQLRAKMEMQDNSTVELTALSGTYDVKAEILTLENNIHLVSSTGYEGTLSTAVIDVRKGNVVSDQPVWVKMLNGFLNAKRLDIVDQRQRGPLQRRGDDAATGQECRQRRRHGRRQDRATNDAPPSLLRRTGGADHCGAGGRAGAVGAAEPVSGIAQGQSKDQPVQIEAATLEVRDKNKTGDLFRQRAGGAGRHHDEVPEPGRVLRPGSRTWRRRRRAGANAKPAPGMPQGAQNIRRIEARGGVTVITKDQNASGDLGIYDLKTKTITLSGNVVVSQGQNVIHGERVVVDMTTGNARVESGSSNGGGAGAPGPGRVRALIQPGKGQNGGPTNFMTIGPGRPIDARALHLAAENRLKSAI